MSLVIKKETDNLFSLTLDGGEAIKSEANRLTTIGNLCNFKTVGGANVILKQNIQVTDITLVSDGTFTFSNTNDLFTKLFEVGFLVKNGTGSGGLIDRFDELGDTFSYIGNDKKFVRINESSLKLEAVAISTFTAQDKTKLDNIETGAQVNVQSDASVTDPNNPAYIKNFPTINSFFSDTYNEVFLNQNSNAITLPIGVKPLIVMVDRGVRYVASEYTIADNILTISGDTLVNADVYVVGMKQ